MFAEALAGGQVLAARREVVALEQHAGHPDVHVGRAAQRLGARRRGRQVERLLVGAQRGAELALGAADVAEGDAAAEDVGEEPDAGQAGDGFGVGGVGAGQVAGGPRREPGQRAGRGPGEGVVRRGQRQRRPRVRDGAVEIAVASASAARYISMCAGSER